MKMKEAEAAREHGVEHQIFICGATFHELLDPVDLAPKVEPGEEPANFLHALNTRAGGKGGAEEDHEEERHR